MKNIKKVLAVMTAVSAFAASSSAFAEATFTATADGDNDTLFTYTEAVYNEETSELTTGNTVTINSVPEGALTGEMTLLVLDHDADTTNVADGDILYIDQGTYTAASGETAATNPEFVGKALGLKVADLLTAVDTTKAGVYNYPVKVGYYTTVTQDDPDGFAIADGNIVITVSEDATVANTVTLKWGDLNGDGYADGNDAIIDMLAGLDAATAENIAGSLATVQLTAGTSTFNIVGAPEGYTSLVWGDLNGDGYADGNDAIIDMLAGLDAATAENICNGTISTTAGETQIKIDLTNNTVEFLK